MKCCSDNNFIWSRRAAFSLPETAAALVILALVCTSIVIVFDRSITSAADSALRMQAFEVAQGNMERLLASSSVKESVEYGSSEEYPAIEWQSAVETFFEPITSRLWARAVCSADYIDSDGRQQKVELANWVTDLTQQQVLELIGLKPLQQPAGQESESSFCGTPLSVLNKMPADEFWQFVRNCPDFSF